MTYKQLILNLEELRKKIGLSQEEMGELLGLRGEYVRQQYSKMTKGDTGLRLQHLLSLSESRQDIDISELFKEAGNGLALLKNPAVQYVKTYDERIKLIELRLEELEKQCGGAKEK